VIIGDVDALRASDEELVRRFGAGDAAAFAELYGRYEMRVFRYLQRSVRTRALAQDLFQETWFAVAQDAPRYQPTAPFAAWLFTIARHRLIDCLRGSSRKQLSLDELGEDCGERVLAEEAGSNAPYAAAVAGEELTALVAALEQLPEEQRDAFLLQQEGGLAVEDIAALSGCSFETAKSRLRYARGKLRELLQEHV